MKYLLFVSLLLGNNFLAIIEVSAQHNVVNKISSQHMGDADLRITSYLLFDGKKRVLADKTEELLQSNVIRLRPNDKFIRLDFQLPDSNTGIHHYTYMIQGLRRLSQREQPFYFYTIFIQKILQDFRKY